MVMMIKKFQGEILGGGNFSVCIEV